MIDLHAMHKRWSTEALAYVDALHRVAFHLTGNAHDAEDLVQDTYARALGASSRFEEGTNLRAWLFRILRNAYIDTYRRARINPVEVDGGDAAASDSGVVEEPAQLRAIVAEDIEAALMTLTENARTIILLDHEGFTETELASVLGCAVGTVKSRLTRARKAMRERLRDYAR
jgi:RNA polymerase sigma-70 factor (ECF subfamily)